jgi:hypothetical protein
MKTPVIGFAGLGVMGEPMCRNILNKSGAAVWVFDLDPAPVARLVAAGATQASGIAKLASSVDVLILSLPGGPEVEAVILGDDGVLVHAKTGMTVVDMSTAPVGLTRDIAKKLAANGIAFADAPVARTRQAAEDGTLSIMVGSSMDVFDQIRPILAHAATDITHCGDVGCGQVVKILNNMVLIQTVVALSEALTLGHGAGVDSELLFDTMSKGSADSFALRNHGMKAMLLDAYPKGAFPINYALKDISYALALAEITGFHVPGAELAKARMEKARDAGFADEYFPVLARVIDQI